VKLGELLKQLGAVSDEDLESVLEPKVTADPRDAHEP
jgi:hypothetical protein